MARLRPLEQAAGPFCLTLSFVASGIPLAWKKGALHGFSDVHRWIGIDYSLTDEGALMRLPPEYLQDLVLLLDPLSKNTGVISFSDLDIVIGKAARVAHVVPQAKPFVAGLWGALSAVQRLGPDSRKEAPPGFAACRRFSYSAAWLLALIRQEDDVPIALERLVTPRPPSTLPSSGWSTEFDASIYGGGAILKSPNGTIVQYFSVVWSGDEAPHLPIWTHDCKHQTFWEFCTLLLTLVVWGDKYTDHSLHLLGDNTGSLQNALDLKGRGPLLAVAREISWRQARRKWSFTVGHIPSEHNDVADALSRVADPAGAHGWPRAALAGADAVTPPKLHSLWLAAPR
jgi:hypothetical protein